MRHVCLRKPFLFGLKGGETFEFTLGEGQVVQGWDEGFASMNLHPRLEALVKAPHSEGGFGFDRPTIVQSRSIKTIIDGRSTFVKSQTGSGKTLAYLLPIVHRLQSLLAKPTRSDGTYALILAPTRE